MPTVASSSYCQWNSLKRKKEEEEEKKAQAAGIRPCIQQSMVRLHLIYRIQMSKMSFLMPYN